MLLGGAQAAIAQQADSTATPVPAAPAATKPPLLLGYTNGLLLSSYLGSDAADSHYRVGIFAGLVADLPIAPHFVVHPEALFSQKGARYSGESDLRNSTLSYVELPVLVRHYTQTERTANAGYLEFGPRVSALLAARDDNGNHSKANFNTFDAGFILGGGLRAGNGIVVGLRYDVGILNVYRQVPAAASAGRGDYQSNVKNDALSLTVSFPLYVRPAATSEAAAARP